MLNAGAFPYDSADSSITDPGRLFSGLMVALSCSDRLRAVGTARSSAKCASRRPGRVKSFGVVFFRSGGDGGQGGATVDAVGAVVGLEHVGQVSQ